MSSTAQQLFGQEHVQRYRDTDGEVGHIWKEDSTILLLTTKGRRTGQLWPHYDEYATRTDREIPVVVLERI